MYQPFQPLFGGTVVALCESKAHSHQETQTVGGLSSRLVGDLGFSFRSLSLKRLEALRPCKHIAPIPISYHIFLRYKPTTKKSKGLCALHDHAEDRWLGKFSVATNCLTPSPADNIRWTVCNTYGLCQGDRSTKYLTHISKQ